MVSLRDSMVAESRVESIVSGALTGIEKFGVVCYGAYWSTNGTRRSLWRKQSRLQSKPRAKAHSQKTQE